MDIDRARTVLEIVHSGSFLRAADRLHVTQTIVSSRIRVVAWGGELSLESAPSQRNLPRV
ncbi:LysR family transcriptional regulator [Mesorhizobium sp. VK4C]|uniref:LysR family transcriptional regulator n=1 Tax=Mesorhizobium captivum TaxID=3072319 RepID=UPI002A24AE28|nr:LysR family transcriptional regulator [Mesorhizobium sp. VK4C]MDX8502990.1 LysR family transcriptional regulator [Mesorhizobium sp. VK4C]